MGSVSDIRQTPAELKRAAKAWINAACAEKQTAEPLERLIAELEMRLHLACDDLAASLEEHSETAVHQIPRAELDIAALQGETEDFASEVQHISQRIAAAAAAADHDLASIAELHAAKMQMERASSTLKETSQLAESFGRADQILASGNFQNISSVIQKIQRGMSLVGNVPEFRGGLQRLEVLRDEFQKVVEPELMTAIAHKEGQKCQHLANHLRSIDRLAVLERIYLSAKLGSLQEVWTSIKPPDASQGQTEWLLLFFEGLLQASKAELAWTAAWLPQSSVELVKQLLQTFFATIEKQLSKALATLFLAGKQQDALHTLADIQVSVKHYLAGLHQQFSELSVHEMNALLTCANAPFALQLSRYQNLEGQRLRIELQAISLPMPGSTASDRVPERLSNAVIEAFLSCEGAIARCWQCTSGTEVQPLMTIIDTALEAFLKELTESVEAHVEAVYISSGPQETGSEASATLPFSHLAKVVQIELAKLSASLIRKVQSLRGMLTAASSGLLTTDPAQLWLKNLPEEKLFHLEETVAAAEKEGFVALQRAALKVDSFANCIRELMYSALMKRVQMELMPVPNLPIWEKASAEARLNLPAFSAYPQAYATAAGEYLMMLPQLLEALQDDAVSNSGNDAAWLDRVAVGAADLYAQKLAHIASLTPLGCQQLAADLEYFCNVLAALGVRVPCSLATWLVAISMPEEEIAQMAKADSDDIDLTSLAALIKARGLVLP